MDVPFQQLTAAQRHKLLHASVRGYKGILPFLRDLEEKRYKQYIRVFLRQYQTGAGVPDLPRDQAPAGVASGEDR